MELSTPIRDLLAGYYEGFERKKDWESFLSDDFRFTGGDMTHTDPQVGKAAYRVVIQRLSRLYTGMRVSQILVEGDQAFVIANYDYVLPNGKKISGDVGEYWKAKGGKLTELRIFFDTAWFINNSKT